VRPRQGRPAGHVPRGAGQAWREVQGPQGGAGRRLMAGTVQAPTEERNPRTADIDKLPTLDVLRLLNAEDALVADAVADVLPELARAVDIVVERLGAGGHMHYFGAGTSGRLAALDAAELPPTFSVPGDL